MYTENQTTDKKNLYKTIIKLFQNGENQQLILLLKSRFIRSLDLSNISLEDKDIKNLSFILSKNKTLLDLNLENTKINNENLKILGKALILNKTLQTINLAHNFIDEDGIVLLSEFISKNGSLTYINLKNNFKMLPHLPINCITEDSRLFSFNVEYNINNNETNQQKKIVTKSYKTDSSTTTELYIKQSEVKLQEDFKLFEDINHIINLTGQIDITNDHE